MCGGIKQMNGYPFSGHAIRGSPRPDPYNPPPMRRYFPDIEAFRAAAKDADVVPVYRQLLADRLTPVSAFQVLGRDEHAFLLESVIGGEKVGRYSFIATAPSLVYEVA